jgi:hypothetical protein
MIEVGGNQAHPVAPIAAARGIEEVATIARPAHAAAWRQALLDEVRGTAVRERLARGLAGVGVIHLICFLGCQAVYDPAIKSDPRHPMLWVAELAGVLVYLRIALGRDWHRSTSAISLVAKFWTTFLILSFNLVTLNAVTGFGLDWYKPVWATLSTFFFASLGWLFSAWYFIPAVQMWATGLLMVHLPGWCYLIYGVSWWLALTGIALWIRPRERPGEVGHSTANGFRPLRSAGGRPGPAS